MQDFLFHHSSSVTDLCYIPCLAVFLLTPLNKEEFITEEKHFHTVSKQIKISVLISMLILKFVKAFISVVIVFNLLEDVFTLELLY